MTTTRIEVGGERPYPVLVGTGICGELPALVGDRATTVVVIYPEGLERLARPACDALGQAGYTVLTEPVPPGEAAKDISVATALWVRLGAHRVGRDDVIVGVGGGAVTDLAGFVGATWLRGIRVILAPTTLLAAVDAAIGGKTAVNTAAGKNLVGAFHPPVAVLADMSALTSLPRREYISGMAEVIKAGFIADPVILDLVMADLPAAPGGPHERELVERSIRMKAAVVTADLREAGQREVLNYGHTLGHAIERVENFGIPHGEAVAIGMVFAAAVARLAGRLDQEIARMHGEVLASVRLPTRYEGGSWAAVREAMAVDKKNRGRRLRLVVLDGLAKPSILADPAEELLEQAFAEVT